MGGRREAGRWWHGVGALAAGAAAAVVPGIDAVADDRSHVVCTESNLGARVLVCAGDLSTPPDLERGSLGSAYDVVVLVGGSQMGFIVDTGYACPPQPHDPQPNHYDGATCYRVQSWVGGGEATGGSQPCTMYFVHRPGSHSVVTETHDPAVDRDLCEGNVEWLKGIVRDVVLAKVPRPG